MSEERKVPFVDRFVAVVVVVAAAVTVGFLLSVSPDARGHGTHEQLGMLRCSWPLDYGIPCPTCGCTTAATHLVHLSPWKSIVTQPFGALAAGYGLFVAFVAMRCLWRGESFVERISLWNYARVFLIGIAALLLAWGYKWLTWPGGAG